MVESIGLCEKHELPLDRNGECELCRLSDMPSKSPPARSAWWALLVPVLVLLAVGLWIYGSLGSDPEAAPKQGVQPVATEPARQVTPPTEPVEEPVAEEPEAPVEPPDPEDFPRPDDIQMEDIPTEDVEPPSDASR